jgi:hypothetical protein
MTKISSSWTFYYKRVFPAVWYAIIALWLAIVLFIGPAGAPLVNSPALMIIAPVALAVVGFFVLRRTLWSLADEVYDNDDTLHVRKGRCTVEIPLTAIERVSATFFFNPSRITLHLTRPGELGDRVRFIPERYSKYHVFEKPRLARDLELRIEQAKARQLGGEVL